jgi:hypothetical protein
VKENKMGIFWNGVGIFSFLDMEFSSSKYNNLFNIRNVELPMVYILWYCSVLGFRV